jgi:hypothetical protein
MTGYQPGVDPSKASNETKLAVDAAVASGNADAILDSLGMDAYGSPGIGDYGFTSNPSSKMARERESARRFAHVYDQEARYRQLGGTPSLPAEMMVMDDYVSEPAPAVSPAPITGTGNTGVSYNGPAPDNEFNAVMTPAQLEEYLRLYGFYGEK